MAEVKARIPGSREDGDRHDLFQYVGPFAETVVDRYGLWQYMPTTVLQDYVRGTSAL
jgi:hypothetical protein